MIGILILLGTVGALDRDLITVSAGVIQSGAGIALMAVESFIVNLFFGGKEK